MFVHWCHRAVHVSYRLVKLYSHGSGSRKFSAGGGDVQPKLEHFPPKRGGGGCEWSKMAPPIPI